MAEFKRPEVSGKEIFGFEASVFESMQADIDRMNRLLGANSRWVAPVERERALNDLQEKLGGGFKEVVPGLRSVERPNGKFLGVIIDLADLGIGVTGSLHSGHAQAYSDFLKVLPSMRILNSPRADMLLIPNSTYAVLGCVDANAGHRVAKIIKSMPENVKMMLVNGLFEGQGEEFQAEGLPDINEIKQVFDCMVASGQEGGIVSGEYLCNAIEDPVGALAEERLFSTATADVGDDLMGTSYKWLSRFRSKVRLAEDGPEGLVGNEDKLEQMKNILADPEARVITIEGQMGVGKSKLMQVLQNWVQNIEWRYTQVMRWIVSNLGEQWLSYLQSHDNGIDLSTLDNRQRKYVENYLEIKRELKSIFGEDRFNAIVLQSNRESIRTTDFINLSFPAKSKDPAYAGCPYFGLSTIIDYLGTILEERADLFHSDLRRYPEVMDIINYANCSDANTEDWQLAKLAQDGPAVWGQKIGYALHFLRELNAAKGVDTVIFMDDLHFLADKESQQEIIKIMNNWEAWGANLPTNLRGKLVQAGRPEQLHEGGGEVINQTMGVSTQGRTRIKLDKPDYLASLDHVVLGPEVESYIPLAEKFLLECFRGQIKGTDFRRNQQRMDKEQVKRLVTLADNLPLSMVYFMRRLRRQHEDGENVFEVNDNSVVIVEDVLAELEKRDEGFVGSQVEVEIASRLQSLDEEQRNFLKVLSVFRGKISFDSANADRVGRSIQSSIGKADGNFFDTVTSLANSGFVEMVVEGTEITISFLHEATRGYLMRTFDQEGATQSWAQDLVTMPELRGVMEIKDVLNGYALAIASDPTRLSSSEWEELTDAVCNWAKKQMEVVRDFPGMLNVLEKFANQDLFVDFATNWMLQKAPHVPEGVNVDLQVFKTFVVKLFAAVAEASCEMALSSGDSLLSLLMGIREHVSETYEPELAYAINRAIFRINDRQPQAKINKDAMEAALASMRAVPQFYQNQAEITLCLARLDYRRQDYHKAIELLQECYEEYVMMDAKHKFENNTEQMSPWLLEWYRNMARFLYELIRRKGFVLEGSSELHTIAGMDPDVKDFAAVPGKDPETLEKISQYLDTALVSLVRSLDGMRANNPAAWPARQAVAIRDLAVGTDIINGDYYSARKMAVEMSEREWNLEQGLKDAALRYDHFVMITYIMEAIKPLLNEGGKLDINELFEGIKYGVKSVGRFRNNQINQKHMDGVNVIFDLFRALSWYVEAGYDKDFEIYSWENLVNDTELSWLREHVDNGDAVTIAKLFNASLSSFRANQPVNGKQELLTDYNPEVGYAYSAAIGVCQELLDDFDLFKQPTPLAYGLMHLVDKIRVNDNYGERDLKKKGLLLSLVNFSEVAERNERDLFWSKHLSALAHPKIKLIDGDTKNLLDRFTLESVEVVNDCVYVNAYEKDGCPSDIDAQWWEQNCDSANSYFQSDDDRYDIKVSDELVLRLRRRDWVYYHGELLVESRWSTVDEENLSDKAKDILLQLKY